MEKGRILVVDDDRDICETIRLILDLKDYGADVAYDGFQALDAIGKEKYDAVLLDIKMPLMNGVETLKKIKEIEPGLPVIMNSAYAVEDLIKEALREGAFAALKKPIDFDLLFETINDARQKGGFILVVDDEEDICEFLRVLLEGKGYSVKVACDGESAVRKARTKKFDVVILDMKLPVMNGYETYLAIREYRPYVSVIVITGYPDETSEMVRKVMEDGAFVCLQKPMDNDQLLDMVEGIVSHSKDQG